MAFGNNLSKITKHLILINLIVWLFQIVLIKKGIDLSSFLGLHYVESKGFYFYQIFTYMFLHDTNSFMHLFSNMFALFMFGAAIEKTWGEKRFLTYYFVTGIGAGLFQIFVAFIRIQFIKESIDADSINIVYSKGYDLLAQGMNYTDSSLGSLNSLLNSVSIGASGSVFGILLAFGMMFPNDSLFIIPIPFPIKAKWFVLGYGLFELFFGIANFSWDNVAHFAHIGGILFGIILILYWKKKDKRNGVYYL